MFKEEDEGMRYLKGKAFSEVCDFKFLLWRGGKCRGHGISVYRRM